MALRKEITAKILDLLRQNPQGLNITAIVQNININRNTAGRYLENLMVSGQVEMRRFGMAKIYRLAKRVPLSAMLSISSELIMLLDSSMRVIYANDQFLQFCGTTQKDLYGKNIEYTPCATAFDDAFDSLKKQIRAGISGKEWYGELTLQQKGVVFACRIAPAVFEEGQRGVSVMFDDITGRKQAERTIQESERQFRLLAEHSLDMIHRHTPDDICIYISPASKTILGYDPDELIGRPVFKVLHPDDAHNVPDYKSRLNRKNHTAKISYRVRHRDGHYVWLESVLRAIFDEKTGELVEIYGVTRDITRRNRAEQAQRESEERYRSLVEISPDPVILHQEGKIVYMNPAAFRLIGASPSDAVIGKNILDFIHPDFRNAVKKNIIKDLRGDSTPLMELTMVRIDGTPVIVEGRGVRTIINGKPAVQVAIKDITRRKQAEAALQESEQKYRDIFEKSVLGLFRTAPDGRVIDANDALARMYGYSGAAEMVAAVPDVGRYYANPEERKKMLHTLAKKGIVENYETLHLKRDGTRFWVSITVRTVRNTDGTVLFYEGSNIDITERKRAEAALRESEARFRSYFDMPLHGIAITSPEKGWLQVNDRICSILGYTRDEIIHMTWAEMTHPDDLAADVEQFNRIVSGEIEQYTLDKRFIRKDGRVIWISIAVGCVRKPDGTVDYIVGLMEDITERKRAEEALKERLKELNCLFGMSALLELPGISLDEILKRTVLLLPPAWQFPEITEACIVVEGQTFQTARFRETSWMLTREIMVHGKPAGQVEVCYLEERPASNEGPFLTDERYLLKAIAERLGRIIERKRMEEALKESEAKFRNLFENAVVGFFRSSHDGRLIGANPAYAKMYGYQDPDSIIREITNVGVQLYANPDDRNKILATLAAQGYLEPTEVRLPPAPCGMLREGYSDMKGHLWTSPSASVQKKHCARVRRNTGPWSNGQMMVYVSYRTGL
jgi:PAS domain S-box-containing protein